MSWPAIWGLVAGAYLFKAFGVLGLGRASATSPGRFQPVVALIPAALFSALIAVQTVSLDETLVLDARIFGVAAGAISVWRKAPFVVVVVVSMAVTAVVRWQT
jgi:branched-subunit amino acid transport protein